MSEPSTERSEPSSAALARREELQLELWYERQRLQIEIQRADLAALDAAGDGPMTPRQRLAHARMLAQSGIVPAGFRGGAKRGAEMTERQLEKAAADIVLAGEIGTELGMSPALALMHLEVVEGNVQLKNDSARGLLTGKGCRFGDETTWNGNGLPVAHTTTFRRPEWDYDVSVTFTIEQAAIARLVEIERDDEGQVAKLRARSQNGDPLPWELYTADMLRHRADSRVIRMHARDLTAGLDVLSLPEPQVAPRRVEYTVPNITVTPVDVPPVYDPQPDVDLIREATGSGDWRPHAGKTVRSPDNPSPVRRRGKVQLAADRLAKWATEDPGAASNILGLIVSIDRGEPVDAEIVDEPVATQPTPPEPTGAGRGFPGAGPGDPTLDDARAEVDAKLAATYEAELAQAWSDATDLLGDRAREVVFSWVRTELPNLDAEGPEDLRPDHVRLYLRTMEGEPDE